MCSKCSLARLSCSQCSLVVDCAGRDSGPNLRSFNWMSHCRSKKLADWSINLAKKCLPFWFFLSPDPNRLKMGTVCNELYIYRACLMKLYRDHVFHSGSVRCACATGTEEPFPRDIGNDSLSGVRVWVGTVLHTVYTGRRKKRPVSLLSFFALSLVDVYMYAICSTPPARPNLISCLTTTSARRPGKSTRAREPWLIWIREEERLTRYRLTHADEHPTRPT